ncbi:MAG: ribosome biogenesis GTPase Der [Alphaproteobacteria bacterium]|nr:ribosome biogenesis GTPase Der [Alphaproteobacteria bacterium]MBL0717875.1 ribosome biogenesis GTPase Der [Alphaproteobacteria bacterium]
MKKILLIGRTNVGKSTLFNLLSKSNSALVLNQENLTRDIIEGKLTVDNDSYVVYDSPGLENIKLSWNTFPTLWKNIIEEVDLVIIVLDGIAGITHRDDEIIRFAFSFDKTIIGVINKSDSSKFDFSNFVTLPFNITPVSAEHGTGKSQLIDLIQNNLGESVDDAKAVEFKIAVVGRPNAGKSTLINSWTKQDRLATSPIEGTTRDSVFVPAELFDDDISLIDTAGRKKRNDLHGRLDIIMDIKAQKIIFSSQIVLLLIDAQAGMNAFDKRLAMDIIEKEKGIIIVLNKWDLIPDSQRKTILADINHFFHKRFFQITKPLIIPVSAIDKWNMTTLQNNIQKLREATLIKTKTNQLNKWLQTAVDKKSPPYSKIKRPIKLKYITQTHFKPPKFTIFLNRPGDLPQGYRLYLAKSLAKQFQLESISIKLEFKATKNPFVD